MGRETTGDPAGCRRAPQIAGVDEHHRVAVDVGHAQEAHVVEVGSLVGGQGRAGGDDAIVAFDGFNRGAMGIGYIGCYGNCDYLGIPNAEPSTEMLAAGNELIAWKVGQNEPRLFSWLASSQLNSVCP